MPSLFKSLIPGVTVYKFKPDEHREAGEEVFLYRLTRKGKKVRITGKLPVYAYDEKRKGWQEKGQLSYGEMVALAEDYFSASGPISRGKNPYVRQAIAVEHYNALARKGVEKKGKKIFKIAGGCSNSLVQTARYTLTIGPSYLQLLLDNFDHFSPNTQVAYETCHAVALDLAYKAYQLRMEGKYTESNKYLCLAYSMNAVACHPLSDMYAGGHAAVPRQELTNKFGGIPGGLLSNCAHNRDGKEGVSVHNEHGDKWVLFGDGNFGINANEKNRLLIALAMQASANEIFKTYETGIRPTTREVEKHMPLVDVLESGDGKVRPLFKKGEDGKLQIQKNPSNPHGEGYKPFRRLTVIRHAPTLFSCLVKGGAASKEKNAPTLPKEEKAHLEQRLATMRRCV